MLQQIYSGNIPEFYIILQQIFWSFSPDTVYNVIICILAIASFISVIARVDMHHPVFEIISAAASSYLYQ